MTAAILALALAAPPALDGTWFAEDFHVPGSPRETDLEMAWRSALTIAGGRFRVEPFIAYTDATSGRFVFDPAHPKHIQVVLGAFKLPNYGPWIDVPAGPRPGVFAVRGDTFRLAFNKSVGGARPKSVDDDSATTFRLILKRAPAGVTAMPEQVAVTVTGPGGEPVAGVRVSTSADFGGGPQPAARAVRPERVNPATLFPEARAVVAAEVGPHFRGSPATDAAGRAVVPISSFWRNFTLIAFDPATLRVAYLAVSPATVAGGKIALRLADSREVAVRVKTPGGGALGGVACELLVGGRAATQGFTRNGGVFEFLAPPGDYALRFRSRGFPLQQVELTVPPGEWNFDPPAVTLKR